MTPSEESGNIVDFNIKAGPWVIFVPQGDPLFGEKIARFSGQGGVVRSLEGREMASPDGLYREFAQKLNFPNYFGYNWDALVDCLDDLHGDWHGNRDVVIIVKDFDMLINASYMPLFVSVLCQAAGKANAAFDDDGEPFYRQAVALHFLLLAKREDFAEILTKLTISDHVATIRNGYLVVE